MRSRALLLVLSGVVAMGARCGEPRPDRPAARVASAEPGSCDGFVDYGDELVASEFRLGWSAPVGGGAWAIEIDFDLTNQGDAHFRAASATPNFSDLPELGIVAASLPADFGAIGPFGTASSTVPMMVTVPAAHFDELMQRLLAGDVPMVVHADEAPVLAPNVQVLNWGAREDRYYYLASRPSGGVGWPPNVEPEPPFEPGEEFGVGFLEFTDNATSVLDEFDPNTVLYLVEDPTQPLVNIPDALGQVRVVDVVKTEEDGNDADDGYTLWAVRLQRTDTESMPSIWSTASWCTGAGSHVDLPVQASRVYAGDDDGNPQAIRFNDIPFGDGAVTLSGQIAGHVLKPSISLRLRHGRVLSQAEVDTDMTLSAELRALASKSFDPEEQRLWSLCFPLPSLPAGPISIPMNLQLEHFVGVGATIGAGAVVGFEKHFESGFHIACEGGPNVDEDCASEGRRDGTPIQFTPPRLTDDTAAHARVETRLSTSLNLGSAYPICDAGPGLAFDATAYGTLDVTPTEDPWWSVGYGLDTWAGIELDLLGLEIAEFGGDPFSVFDPAPSSADPAVRTSGEDQRWAVAIDDVDVPNGVSSARVTAFPDGSSLAIATEAVGQRNPLVKLDRYGALVWAKNFYRRVRRVHALPDGTAIAAGSEGYYAWLARIDADGNLLWSSDIQLSRTSYTWGRCSINDLVALEQSPGVYDYVAVGGIGTGLVTTGDACAFRVNADGSIPWARIYIGPRGQSFSAITATRDGNVVVGGADNWYYGGVRRIPLFVKLDPDDGGVIFWKGMPMTRLGGLDSVVEGSDGAIYGVGDAAGTILTTGAGVIARIEADGSDARQALLFQDESWEEELAFETWENTAGGDTAYDEYYDIAESGDGFVVVGHTGLGTSTAARVAKINRNLGVEWFTTFDGASTENLTGVAAAADGLFVSGYSASLPEADGGSGENQLWVMKLPFTGGLDFLPDVGMTTRFVAPGVLDTNGDHGPNPLDEPLVDNPYSTEDAVFVSAEPNPTLLRAGRDLLPERQAPGS
jgi:hypothetical protein